VATSQTLDKMAKPNPDRKDVNMLCLRFRKSTFSNLNSLT